jgi:2-(1,2-epoxy-1,2-dihydrophenyl)acetyl-CoA isomerase
MRKSFERAYVTKHNDIAILTLNHPEVLNAASFELIQGFSDALYYIEAPENNFHAAILTGEGKGFCSGVNLKNEEIASTSRGIGSVLETQFHPLLRHLRDFKLPLVCAINGAAAGIGMSISLSGDILMAARSAYFIQAFAKIGLVPDGGSTWLLPRSIGLARAKELSILAEKLPAETALSWGLINRVCDDELLMEEAIKIAERLANGPKSSLALIRTLYVESLNNSYEEQLDLEARMQDLALGSKDFAEGIAAFREKRPPNFKDKS